MGSIRRSLAHIRRLRRELTEDLHTLTLPNGAEVRYQDRDLLDALEAAANGEEEHWLIPPLRELDARQGMEGLVAALDRSWRNLEEAVEET